MKIMRKLLANLGDVWNTLPKSKPMLSIETLKHPNIIGSDGSFKADSDGNGLANGWQTVNVNYTVPGYALVANSKYGMYQRLDALSNDTNGARRIEKNNVYVEAGKFYVAIVDADVSGAAIARLSIASNTATVSAPGSGDSSVRKTHIVKFTPSTSGTIYYRLYNAAAIGATGSVWFEGAALYEVSASLYARIGADINESNIRESIPFTTAAAPGPHSMVTIGPGIMYFHSTSFRSDLPVRQEILLDGLTTAELIATISGMGYLVSLTSEAVTDKLDVHSAITLLEVENVGITSAAKLEVYTSRLWKTMYPIYRVLEEAERDMDVAIRQLYRDMASGQWLDYWASFFSISRDPGEGDNDFIRRFTMWLFNPKTNNVALRELLSYTLKDNSFKLEDAGPNMFSVTAGLQYLNPDYAAKVHKVLTEAKAAGVEYFLNYASEPYIEDYRLYWADATGKPYNQNDSRAFRLQKVLTEATWTTPTDTRTDTDMTKTLSETVPKPVDVSTAGVTKPFTETDWSKPTEAVAGALQLIYTETKAVPTELRSMLIQKPAEDTYTGFSLAKQSNIDTCFTLNDSEIRDDSEMLSTAYNGLKDVATMILTKAGVPIKTYVV